MVTTTSNLLYLHVTYNIRLPGARGNTYVLPRTIRHTSQSNNKRDETKTVTPYDTRMISSYQAYV